MNLLSLYMLYIHNVTDWAVTRKRIGKHAPKRSIGAHCYATVLVLWFTACSVTLTVASRYPRQRIVQNTAIRLTVGNSVPYSIGWRVMSDTEVRSPKSEARSEVFSLCGVITTTFRLLSLFVVTKCYSYSKIESVIINCGATWWISNKSTHRAKPASKVTNTRDMFLL
jgi:protein-S-isoprenylcysteine O-methyltransferase Ste14